jgi:DNA-binding MarR family transcriptional regulator
MTGMDKKEKIEAAKAVSAECIAVRVRLINRVITNVYDRAFRRFDIKINQASILVFLTVRDGSSTGDVGKALKMEKSTVSRNVERMRKKGWVEIEAGDDGPSQVIRVTGKGSDLLAAIHGEWMKAQEAARGLLGEEGVRSVQALYDTLSRSGFNERDLR